MDSAESTVVPDSKSHVPVPSSWTLLVVAGFVFGLGPQWWAIGRRLFSRPEYHYFPIVLIVVVLLYRIRWQEADASSRLRRSFSVWLELAVLSGALAGQVLAIALPSPLVSGYVTLMLVAVACLAVQRQRDVTDVWAIWGLLWLCVPIPLNFDQTLASLLQGTSSRFSERLLDSLKVDHLMSGNVLQLPDHRLFVDEACGGIVSVMSLVACAAMFCVWHRRSRWHSVAILLSGVFWAVVVNVVRISSIAFALHRFGVDLSSGMAHSLIGMSCLAGACVLIFSTDRLLTMLVAPIELPADIAIHEEAWNPLLRRWNVWRHRQANTASPQPAIPPDQPDGDVRSLRIQPVALCRIAIGFSAAFALLGFWQAAAYTRGKLSIDEANPHLASHVLIGQSVTPGVVPKKVNGWSYVKSETIRRGKGSGFGEFSTIFHYETDAGQHATVSLDYPFSSSWHELTFCYRGLGWKLVERKVTLSATESGDRWNYVEAEFARLGELGFLSFGMMDSTGTAVSPLNGDFVDQIAERLMRNRHSFTGNTYFQVQVWLHTEQALSAAEKESLRHLFQASRDAIRSHLMRRAADEDTTVRTAIPDRDRDNLRALAGKDSSADRLSIQDSSPHID